MENKENNYLKRLSKIRKEWKIDPVTQIKESKKSYSRNEDKKTLLKELEEIERQEEE